MVKENLISIAKETTISSDGGAVILLFKFFTLAYPLVSVARRMRHFMGYHTRMKLFARARATIKRHSAARMPQPNMHANESSTARVPVQLEMTSSFVLPTDLSSSRSTSSSQRTRAQGHNEHERRATALVSDAFHGGGRRGLGGRTENNTDRATTNVSSSREGMVETWVRKRLGVDLDRVPTPLFKSVAVFHLGAVVLLFVIAMNDLFGSIDCSQTKAQSIAAGGEHYALFSDSDKKEQQWQQPSCDESCRPLDDDGGGGKGKCTTCRQLAEEAENENPDVGSVLDSLRSKCAGQCSCTREELEGIDARAAAAPSSNTTAAGPQHYAAIECLGRHYLVLWNRWGLSTQNVCGCRGMIIHCSNPTKDVAGLMSEEAMIPVLNKTFGRLVASKSLLSLGIWACPGIGTGDTLDKFVDYAVPNLRSLTIEFSNLSAVPAFLKKATQLNTLGLRVNDIGRTGLNITTAPFAGWTSKSSTGAPRVPSIRRLDLERNSFSSLPAWIFHLNSSLESLVVSSSDGGELAACDPNKGGKIGPVLPLSLGQLGRLTEFEATCQGLHDVSVIGQLTNLNHLRLDYNHIIRIPDSMSKLSRLNKLSLRYQDGVCECSRRNTTSLKMNCDEFTASYNVAGIFKYQNAEGAPASKACESQGCEWSCNNHSGDGTLINAAALPMNLTCLDLERTLHPYGVMSAEISQLTALTSLNMKR
jgi:hypothetical protein